ncbi:MAG: AmmeMemoRadiSam system protein B [Bacteroidota bacterium]
MKTTLLQLVLLLATGGIWSCQGQERKENNIRQPVVAGSFYPADAATLRADLDRYFNGVKDRETDPAVAAIIVPHAGYVFSASVAASAYAKLDPGKEYKRVFVIGTSHHVLLNGASVCNVDAYLTPLGTVPVDRELAAKLIGPNRLIEYNPAAHNREHSIEVQLPFLQYRLEKPFLLVPVIIGTQSAETCRRLAEILRPYFTPENLFVISTDFSHYPAYTDALTVDAETGLAVESLSPDEFLDVLTTHDDRGVPGLATSCCGWSSVLTLLDLMEEVPGIRAKHITYMNSGDSPYGDRDRVVGYQSFIFTREKEEITMDHFSLSAEDRTILLEIARDAITARLEGRGMPAVDDARLSASLKESCGAFVTLTVNGQLRGCIGRFMATQPLWRVVQDMALAAAFSDSRFMPVRLEEMKKIDIEISVLTPLRRISSAEEFRLGEQGIYMIKDGRSGTFLPQVAASTGWNKEEFLGHCARDKAGIGWDGWKSAELYTYEAYVFSEAEPENEK